jgi:hypothetical protein
MNAQIDFCLGNNPLICYYKRFQCIIDQWNKYGGDHDTDFDFLNFRQIKADGHD